MTDMRATERLLEVIEELATNALDPSMGDLTEGMRSHGRMRMVLEAATELRRRGDTLVRRDDLLYALQHLRSEVGYPEMIARLENALGGKLIP